MDEMLADESSPDLLLIYASFTPILPSMRNETSARDQVREHGAPGAHTRRDEPWVLKF
jgi:hypothetical protein